MLKKAIETYKQYMINTEKSNETIRGYMQELRKMERWLMYNLNYPPYLEDITLTHLEEYLGMQMKEGLSSASRSRSYHIIRAFYNYCYKKELIERNIALSLEPIKVKTKEREHLEEEEVLALIQAIDHGIIKVAVETIYHTGLRVSECTNLKIEHVDLEKKIINVVAGKGNKDRIIPISKKLEIILTDYIKRIRPRVNSKYIFATEKSGRLSPQYINREIHAATKILGWDKVVTAHILRHSFASKLVKQEVHLVKIQKLLGHADLRVTSIYTHTNQEELRQAVNTI